MLIIDKISGSISIIHANTKNVSFILFITIGKFHYKNNHCDRCLFEGNDKPFNKSVIRITKLTIAIEMQQIVLTGTEQLLLK